MGWQEKPTVPKFCVHIGSWSDWSNTNYCADFIRKECATVSREKLI